MHLKTLFFSLRLNGTFQILLPNNLPTAYAEPVSFTYIYVLQSLHHDFVYVGITSDLKRRFHEHQSGQNTSTKPYLPYKLIHYEAYICEADAKRRENYFQTTKGRVTLRQMLKEYFRATDL